MRRIETLCILIWWSFTMSFATDFVAITEVLYDVYCDDQPSIMPPHLCEFVELYNANEDEVDIGGWMLQTKEPNQTFIIPEGIIIPPHSCFVIGHDGGDFDASKYNFQTSDFEGGATLFDFWHGIDEYPLGKKLLLQHTFILPDTITTLLLKDKNNVVRDSLVYGSYVEHNTLYAPNSSRAEFIMGTIWSIQRACIQFEITGKSIFHPTNWHGYELRENKMMPNHSLGVISLGFGGIDILPQPWELSNKKNFIQEIIPHKAMSDIDTSQIIQNPSHAMVKRTYYDAMYRPTLTVNYGLSPSQKNIMTLKEYDIYARPTKEWLPIAVEMSYLTNGLFVNNAKQYYANESRPFIEKTYSDAIWENGTTKNELTGIHKAGGDMGTHKMQFMTRGNDSSEVKLFYVTNDGSLRCDSCYFPKRLHVAETIDEDNHTKVTYTNSQEQVVMEKVDNATTYYVYNDLNQLCYVLPPLAVSQLDYGTYSDTIDCLRKYAYVYKYDDRGNQIYKRLPGCKPILMVYDKSNSLVLTQTGNQRRQGELWTIHEYDSLRRLIYTAEVIMPISSHEELIEDYSNKLIVESFSGESQTGYSRNFFTHVKQILTVNYYDDYHHLPLISSNKRRNMIFAAFNGNATCANATGLLTGTRTYYLDGSGDYSETVYYYDYRGREIQRRTVNHMGGYSILSTRYDFSNNITDTWSSQSTNIGIITTEHYQYTYDHANRPLTTTYTFNNESPILLQSYNYDELGRVRSRHIHDGIDSIAFAYDIRSQITKINSSNYEQKYYYNLPCPIGNGTVTPAYNGNISATTWTYENQVNGYMYYYDNMNRLTSTYSILNNEWGDYYYSENFTYDAHGNITNLYRWDDYDVIDNLYMTYNGNQLMQIEDTWETYNYEGKEYHDNNSSTEDDFAYDANGNMLNDLDRGIAAIRYNLLNLPDTIQFADGNQIVHRYDAAGNRLSTDYYTRKLNIPVPLGKVFSAADSISKYHITRDAFLNNIVYTSNNNNAYGIKFVHNPEGYIRYYGPEEHYHFYYIKDLLGNIRETYVHPEAGYKECIQRMQYYPSGLPWEYVYNSSAQPWKYNGKEFVEMHGLDEYDSKARWYYPAICRTTTMDPLAEKYYPTSPYAWCGNNPVGNVDLDGKEIKFAIGTTDSQKEQFWQVVRYLDQHNCGGRYGQLKNSSQVYVINMNVEESLFDGRNREVPTINWTPNKGVETDNGTIMSPATVLNHEMTHATHFDDAKKLLDNGNIDAWNAYAETTKNGTSWAYGSKDEELVITGIEQRTALLLGEIESGQVTRTNHKGTPVFVESPISNKKVEKSPMK